MQVNMLEAKNQLSKLVKAAVAGEEVIIASHGEAQVRLVPCAASPGLKRWGVWADRPVNVDAAFDEQVDEEVARLFGTP
ncbi:type II toxin-antitoxin system Phd/YefM family antitoxin [Thioalkalivibrio paradoxus]|uniref:Antitoxin n=1 Tax=Thioalkalivibrio paradoxus ARh 1 TaxID=713585 RepID=W0DH10_9GAMM|nr:type II toxin-antitoxin system prevent-host-death family antitoxin [Thioalkalivibrio paradoxus]AHE97671.1 prevent-host-death protein [Thioalkalivibrio paradoxus ARh 1]